jgi:hypothetical protein
MVETCIWWDEMSNSMMFSIRLDQLVEQQIIAMRELHTAHEIIITVTTTQHLDQTYTIRDIVNHVHLYLDVCD